VAWVLTHHPAPVVALSTAATGVGDRRVSVAVLWLAAVWLSRRRGRAEALRWPVGPLDC